VAPSHFDDGNERGALPVEWQEVITSLKKFRGPTILDTSSENERQEILSQPHRGRREESICDQECVRYRLKGSI